MTEYSPDVVFNAGAPIDVNKLNQLQINIASVYQTNSIINTTNTKVGEIDVRVRTLPVIDIGSENFTVPAGQCVAKTITFGNENFSRSPVIVASISSNIKADSNLSVRATVSEQSIRQARIEVCSNSKNLQEVTVSYIAVQMKQFD